MCNVLNDADLGQMLPDWTQWCVDRGITNDDELFRVVHMMLVSSDTDLRKVLVDYITSEARDIRRRTSPADLPDMTVVRCCMSCGHDAEHHARGSCDTCTCKALV